MIGDAGAKALAHGLAENRVLRNLCLGINKNVITIPAGSNSIKAEGAKAFAAALLTNDRLRWLDLSMCCCDDL